MNELIIVQNKREEKLFGILDFPNNKGQFPALIVCHGFAQTKSQRKFTKLSKELVANKIAVFKFDFSGHGDSEGEMENISIEKQAEELKIAFDTLANHSNIDKSRVAILGHSLGALVTVLFQTKYNLAKNLILVSPAFHQKELIEEWFNQEQRDLWEKQGYLDTPKGRLGVRYLQEAQSKDWSETARDIKVPVLVLHGKDDDDVLIKYTQDLFDKLNEFKKLIIVKGAEHHFESKGAKEKLTMLTADWLKERL